MIQAILIVIFLLWLLGFLQLPFLAIINTTLFAINGVAISISNILVFILVLWLIGLLPRPFREIVAAIFVLWVVSLFGIIAIGNLSNILILVIILAAVFYVFKK